MKINKIFKNTLLIPVLAFLLCLFMSGCTQSVSVPSESQIQMDLIDNGDMADIRDGYLENVTNFEITKRQTTPEDKIDTVWVHLEAENSEVASQMYFIISYGLYNEGWLLESIVPNQTERWSFTPLQGVDEVVLQSYLPTDATIISNDVDTVSGSQRVEYSYVENYPLCEVVYQQALTFYFGTTYYSSWAWDYAGIEDIGTYENWQINGIWQYYASDSNRTDDVLMIIQDFDPQGIAYDSDSSNDSFAISGSYSYYSWSSMMYHSQNEEDDGPFTVTCKYTPWTATDDRPYTIATSVSTYGNRHQVLVYKDKLILNPWGPAWEMTKIN